MKYVVITAAALRIGPLHPAQVVLHLCEDRGPGAAGGVQAELVGLRVVADLLELVHLERRPPGTCASS